MTRRFAWGGALAIALLFLSATAVGAREATGEEVRRLLDTAGADPSALDELRSITSVDGQPADFESALEGAAPDEIDERLATLDDALQPSDPIAADVARAEAREVLDQSKYKERDVPRPFRGILDAIGDALEPIWTAIYDFADGITGGRPELLLGALALLVAVLAALVARRLIHKRALVAVEKRAFDAGGQKVSAAELESLADEAERNGRLEEAIRLRFRAGLIRLAEAGAIPARVSLTSEEIAGHIRSRSFEEVAGTFDEVVYGRRTPQPGDVERSRSGWIEVLGR